MNQLKCKRLQAAVVAIISVFVLFHGDEVFAQESGEKIAIVNQTDISRGELDREMKLVSFKMTRQGRPVSVSQLKMYEKDICETLIRRTLLLEQAKTLEIGVKESLVEKALDDFKAGFKNEKAYAEELKKIGFTDEMMAVQVREGLTIKALFDKEVLKGSIVSDEQVRAYYEEHQDQFKQPEQVKASHILITVSQDASTEEKEKALTTIQGLKERIEKGANFATLAQEYSECPSKTKGGDLGFFTREKMVPPFSKAAFELAPGEVSDVVETRFGYHLIKVTERKPEQLLTFNDVKSEVKERLRREEEGKRIGAYLKKLESQAEIQRFPL